MRGLSRLSGIFEEFLILFVIRAPSTGSSVEAFFWKQILDLGTKLWWTRGEPWPRGQRQSQTEWTFVDRGQAYSIGSGLCLG